MKSDIRLMSSLVIQQGSVRNAFREYVKLKTSCTQRDIKLSTGLVSETQTSTK
jgi:hypothetical protein